MSDYANAIADDNDPAWAANVSETLLARFGGRKPRKRPRCSRTHHSRVVDLGDRSIRPPGEAVRVLGRTRMCQNADRSQWQPVQERH